MKIFQDAHTFESTLLRICLAPSLWTYTVLGGLSTRPQPYEKKKTQENEES